MSSRQEAPCNMSGLCLETDWGDLEILWIFLLLKSNQLEPKNFECNLWNHFRALYYCLGLKGSPGIALPQSDKLLQAGFGSRKVLTKHVHFCNCRRNSDLPPDGDSVQQGLAILVNYSWGATCHAGLLLVLAAPGGKAPFYLFPLQMWTTHSQQEWQIGGK